jgi:hypothetical protein
MSDTSPHQKQFDVVGEGAPDDDATPEERAERERTLRLDALGESLSKKRGEAIEGRQNSGIETQWLEDEEFYQGIDDANRGEHSNPAWRTKPPGQVAAEPQGGTRSTVFPNITRPYVDAAAARIADMLLPTDDKSFSLENTPIPDLVGLAEGEIPPDIRNQLMSVPGASDADIQKMQQVVVEQAKQILDEAKDKADQSEKRIEDWLVEGQWHAEVRKVIEDSARCGSGVLKGPVPIKRKKMALVDLAQGEQAKPNILLRILDSVKKAMGFDSTMPSTKQLIMKEEISPTSTRRDFWNLFPDPACGESIHNGSYIFERDDLTEKQVSDLLDNPHYIRSQLELVLKDGPMKAVAPSKQEPDKHIEGREGDKRFEIWYFHGTLDKDDMEAAGCQCDDGMPPKVHAVVEMINQHVVKATLNPLDTGDFPYDIMPWQRKSGLPWGNGVARQGRTPQRIVTAAVRNMMDNGGISAGFQMVMKQGLIHGADGNDNVTPRKVWLVGEDADVDDVRKAMTFFEIPSRQAELMEIMQMGMKLMEDSTGLPMLLQGQMGTAPDTVGGMNMLNNNASAVLRRLARTFDDCITEPHIRRYYAWLLQYGKDEEKGDFVIDARGSSALVERDLQAQEMVQMAAIVTNPVFGLDPKKWAQEFLKSRKFDPKNFEFDDEEWKKIVENMSKGPQDNSMAVAKLRGDFDTKITQMEQAFEKQENQKDRALDVALKNMEQSGKKSITLDELKAMLASTAMKLTTQTKLSMATMAQKAATPPTEPAGRAPKGQAFQR